MGGEYNNNVAADTTLGAIYDPVANSWKAVPAPNGWSTIGDAQSILLPNGIFMLGSCCASPSLDALLNASTLTWTTTGAPPNYQNEQGYTLLSNGNVLSVDVGNVRNRPINTTHRQAPGPRSQMFRQSYYPTNAGPMKWGRKRAVRMAPWSPSGPTPAATRRPIPRLSITPPPTRGKLGRMSPRSAGAILYPRRRSGRHAAERQRPHRRQSGTVQSSHPLLRVHQRHQRHPERHQSGCGRCSLRKHIVQFLLQLPLLPSGQVLATDFSSQVEIYTPTGNPLAAWELDHHLVPRLRYARLDLRPQWHSAQWMRTLGSSYGDDAQGATNYPVVRVVNHATGNVYYARTSGHSTMSIAPGQKRD